MKYVAAIDQGTTSTRCLIFNKHGKIVASAQREHKQIYPKPGWVEHDPEEILNNTRSVVQHAITSAKIPTDALSALGITNQRETIIAWNRKTGKPYFNAIVWQDTRTNEICDNIRSESNIELFKSKSGLPISTYFSGPKIKWLIENVETIKSDLPSGNVFFGNIDAWLIWNLTGGVNGGQFVTDVTNASRTMLFNLKNRNWDNELLSILDIPEQSLPRILPSSAIFGWTRGFIDGVPITGVLGDQQAALFGQLCLQPGDAKNTYGTGCFMLLNTGNKIVQSNNGLLTTVAYQIADGDPVYALEGSIAVTGALVQWLRDNIGLITNSPDIEKLAKKAEDNGGVYFVPAFSGLFAPYWDTDARGLIIGLTGFANRSHIARSALESTAYQTYDVLQAMQKDAGIELNTLKVDGGMVANELLMQFQSDILGASVIRPTVTETTSLGAAYAAGLQVGYWASLDDLQENWAIDKRWEPAIGNEERSEKLSKWHEAVDRAKGWAAKNNNSA